MTEMLKPCAAAGAEAWQTSDVAGMDYSIRPYAWDCTSETESFLTKDAEVVRAFMDRSARWNVAPLWQRSATHPAPDAVNGLPEAIAALEAARDAVEYSIEVHGTDHGGMMLQSLNKIDTALAKLKAEP